MLQQHFLNLKIFIYPTNKSVEQRHKLLVKMDYRGSAADAHELGDRLLAELGRQGTPALRMEVLPIEHPHALLMTAMLR